MTKWISCEDGFIVADVVRWTESVWQRRSRRKNAKSVSISQRMVTAEVTGEDADGWVHLLVRACETVGEKPGRKVLPLPLRQEIRRKRSTVLRGKPCRLAWSDETARGALISRFLGRFPTSDEE